MCLTPLGLEIMSKFSSEEHFREWLIEELCETLPEDWQLLRSKNVSDIILCHGNDYPVACFLEVKYHKSNHRRIGFGNGRGKGFQPEILIKRPIYFERNMRWIIANEKGDCLFFDNNDVRNNSAGGSVSHDKQNNFVSKLFEKNQSKCFRILDCAEKICKWLKTITFVD